ncbi:Wzz/FepE/Etk N-terminal domain-containing protein, partial [Omnitrophica bacterium]|nr:Wzz/FepE/Etk N-terminal domain-containing protein [Candidatus Omnitrophota bacterium]
MMPQQPYQNSYIEEIDKPIDYKRYLFLIQKHFYILLIFFIIAVTLAAIYVSRIPDRYTAAAQMIMERPKEKMVGGDSYSSEASAEADDYYRTQIEIMKSLPIMR